MNVSIQHPIQIPEVVEFICLRCSRRGRKVAVRVRPDGVTTYRNGSLAYVGQCPYCRGKVTRFVKRNVTG